MFQKPILGLLLSLFTALSFAQKIKIAIATPTSGPVAQFGQMVINGSTLAVEHVNENGGVSVNGKNYQLETVVYDDACEPKQAVVIANKIINDNIDLIIGHLCSSATLPASDIYEEESALMITPASTTPDLTEQGKEFVFRTIGRDDQQGPFAAQYIISNIKPKNVAVIHDKQQYGEGIASLVRAHLNNAQINVAFYEGITAGEKDYSALVSKLKKSNVDFVYYGGYHQELGTILRQAKEVGYSPIFMGPEGVSTKDILALAGDAAQGLIATQPKTYDSEPRNAKIIEDFNAKGQDSTGTLVLLSYAAVKTLADAMNETNSQDTAQLAEFLRNKASIDTPIGILSWDERGDLQDAEYELVKWSADGSTEKLN